MSEKEIKRKKCCRHGRMATIGFWGVIFLIALFLFLKNAEFFTYSYWSAFATWPLVLFITSIFCLLGRKWISGVFLLIAAKFFWLPYWIPIVREQCLGWLPEGIENGFVRKYWYILIVFLAFLMIIKHLFFKKANYSYAHSWEHWHKANRCRKRRHATSEEKDGFIESNVVFNSIDRIYLDEDFTGGEFNVVFGSQNIDLRKCVIRANEKAYLEVNLVFSGCEIWIPSDWNVVFEANVVFSSFDDNRSEKPAVDDAKNVLVITGACVFSSVEVKN